MFHFCKTSSLIALCWALSASCAAVRADVITDWNESLLQIVATERETPPKVSRALAMMHAAMYDAVNSITKAHTPYLKSYTARADASPEAAAAQAAYDISLELYPSYKAECDKLLFQSLAMIPDGPAKDAGLQVGKMAALGMIAARVDDGANVAKQHPPDFTAGKWRRTPPAYAEAMLPQWADLKPFAMTSPSQFRIKTPPPALSSQEYAEAFNEVKTLGSLNSAERTVDQERIAKFWADGAGTSTPPGHWNRIAQSIVKTKNQTVGENARLFALLNIALADAAICCWDMKFADNCWRPITAIRLADTDGNAATQPDPEWTPLLETPPFPTCTSGHSTFSAAAAWVLILYYQTFDIPVTVVAEDSDESRPFKSVADAAIEAGRSRIYGGIHFQFDNERGINSGEEVGKYVYTTFLTPVEQPAAPASPPEVAASPADRTGQADTEQADAAQADAEESSAATETNDPASQNAAPSPENTASDDQPNPKDPAETADPTTSAAPQPNAVAAGPTVVPGVLVDPAQCVIVQRPVEPLCAPVPPVNTTVPADSDGWRPATTTTRYMPQVTLAPAPAPTTTYYAPYTVPTYQNYPFYSPTITTYPSTTTTYYAPIYGW